jgi:hypothetical protein
MLTDEFLKVTDQGEPPFVIKTRGGLTYVVADRKHFWVPPTFERTVILAVPGQGIKYLDIGSIDEIGIEHEPTPHGRG